MRRLTVGTLVSLVALLLVVGAAFVAGGSEPWTGQGTSDGQLNATECDGDNSPYLLWAFAIGDWDISAATLHLGGSGSGDFTGTQLGTEVQFTTPFFDLSGLTAFVDYEYEVGGQEPLNLSVDRGCPGASADPDPQPAQPLTVVKDASGEYDATYLWTIAKDVDKKTVRQVGGEATFTYTVSVSHGDPQVDEVQVRGVITVSNPNSAEVTLDGLTDEVDGTVCSVDTEGGLTVGPGDTTFPYQCNLGDSLPSGDVYNTVTVAWSEQTLGDGSLLAAGSAGYLSDAISYTVAETDECVFVSDSKDSSYGPDSPRVFCAGDEGDPNFTFEYSWAVRVPRFGCQVHENTATFETSDNQRSRSASQTVTVCGPAETGARGKLFWASKPGLAIVKSDMSTAGVCDLGTWLRQFNPFQDLSPVAKCSQVAKYVHQAIAGSHDWDDRDDEDCDDGWVGSDDRGAKNDCARLANRVFGRGGGDHGGGPALTTRLKAQMLATALNVYFSDAALGGNAINAPDPIGAAEIDLTLICTKMFCREFEDASPAFPSNAGGNESVLDLLVDASNACTGGSNGSCSYRKGPGSWYGNDKGMQELAKDAFAALNAEKAFAP